ncbi:hypothetical protein UZ36_00495 [Candidatus Nitromaritima sp. SCGC AAA799-C22]|nr:hypothetical protein UZ36_00495 [Candidatus Nitromaritima sp. SCGC AAA799-C22]
MDRFIRGGEHTVIDTQTRLMWTRTDSMNDMEKWVNYQDSVDYARELREKKFAGYDNWRLPSRDEMALLYDKSFAIKDKFEKDIHIADCFAPGGGFSMIAAQVPGRMRTWVFNLRTGEFDQPDGLWTLTEAARAVRTMDPDESFPE